MSTYSIYICCYNDVYPEKILAQTKLCPSDMQRIAIHNDNDNDNENSLF